MKRPLASFLVLTALAACGDDDDGGTVDAGPGETRRLVIFHTNDEHSHLFGFAPEIDDYPAPTEAGTGTIVGGIARRAKVLTAERAAATAAGLDSVTASAGDETQGALPQIAFTRGAPDFTLMKELGYDVMCPGNHEFDLGPLAYAAAINSAAANGGLPQIVSTNIKFSDTTGDDALEDLYGEGDSDALIKRYHVVTTASGIKVGFFGVMGIEASSFAPLKVPVLFSAEPAKEGDAATQLPRLYADITPTITKLRDVEKVDVVVMVSHGGVGEIDPMTGDDWNVAKNVPGIDIIVSGHSHTPLAVPQFVEGPDGHEVGIVQAGSYGMWLGRAELILEKGKRPVLDHDPQKTKLISIDDRIVPDDQAMLDKLDGIIEELESEDAVDGQSVLEALWSSIEGAPVVDDPEVVGDLYFRSVGTTDFDVIGLRRARETNVLNLSNDAMMAAAWELAGPTQFAVNATGVVRGDIIKGKTGVMTLADLYRVFPLGVNPADGSVGYPLVRFYLWKAEIKGAFELAASRGFISDSLFLAPGGAKVEFDTGRDAWDPGAPLDATNGRVTKITLDPQPNDGVDEFTEVIFDLEAEDPWFGDQFALYPVVTSWYVASFAGSAGVTLKNENGGPLSLEAAYLVAEDGSDVKEFEAFIGYIKAQSAANGGKLPSRYDETTEEGAVPRRMICSGPLCPAD